MNIFLLNKYKLKTRKMKTTAKRTTLIITALIISLNIFAIGFTNEQKEHIDDIPIDLERTSQEIFLQNTIAMNLNIDEKGFINDWRLPDEDYIDDIPMDLDEIEKQAKHKKNKAYRVGKYHALVRVK